MIENKKINRLAIIFICIASLLSMFLVFFSSNQKKQISEPEYAQKIFGQEIISVEILADEKEWADMIQNANKENFIKADVIVNGTSFKNVGIRAKGNSSLSQVTALKSERYSLRLQFDEYVTDQTCFGLDSFVLNNMITDNSYMKEYLSYDLMKDIGIQTPYFGYATIKVNSVNSGLYLAVETYGKSYETRINGNTSGKMYNVKSMDMAKNDKNQNPEAPQAPPQENNDQKKRNQAPDGNSPMMQRETKGGDLKYTDDDISSYSNIFDNVVGKATSSDFKKIIKALKNLSEGNNLEKYFDIDSTLKYLAAHTFVVNLDSYSSSMAQNYYLYEYKSKITVLPWDYNMAWGGFQSKDSSSVVNFPIDTPVSGVEMSDRPLINQLLSNPDYLEKYHEYLAKILDSYFDNGKLEAKIDELNNRISKLVKEDPTKFCTFEEYKKSVETLKELALLRAQSINGQLSNTIPSTTSEQAKSPEKLIDSTNINLSDLGNGFGHKREDINDGVANAQQNRPPTPPNNFHSTQSSSNVSQNFDSYKLPSILIIFTLLITFLVMNYRRNF